MEVSELFAVGAYRGEGVSAILVISDLLSEEDWNQGYHSAEKLEGLKKIFEVALEMIAINSKNNQESKIRNPK
jgi:purine-nucleoside phosphorylase